MSRPFLGLTLAVLAALALLMPALPVALSQQPAQTTFQLYLPALFNEIPRPYEIPPDTVAVVQSKQYCRDVNSYESVCRVAGEVFNSTARAVRDVSLEQRICDFRGDTVRTEYHSLLLPVVPPGQTVAFSYDEIYGEGANEVGPCGTRVFRTTPSAPPVTLTVVRQERTTRRDNQNYNITRVAGTVRNSGSTPLASATVLVTLYDAGGAIIDARTQSLTGPIAAGATASYSIEFADMPVYRAYAPVVYHTVKAQGTP